MKGPSIFLSSQRRFPRAILIVLILSAGAALASDENRLVLTKGPGSDEILLEWQGPGPHWTVFESSSPQGVAEPPNAVGWTYDPWWIRPPDSESAAFMVVASDCVEGFPEECDGVDNDCDGSIDEDFKDSTGEHYVRRLHCGECSSSCAPWGDCLLMPDCQGSLVPTCTNDASPCIGAECAEECDGIDNDQDCDVDEDFKDPSGTYFLHDLACGACGVACDPAAIPPTTCQLVTGCDGEEYPACASTSTCIGAGCPETCDGIDNDLDCTIDEDFRDTDGRYVTDEHCRACGNDCRLITFDGRPGACNWKPWWAEAGRAMGPTCSEDCLGSCVDVNGNPNDGCECCDPLPGESCGDPASTDLDCDGPDPFDPECSEWPRPEPYAMYCCTHTGPPLTTLIGCDGTPGDAWSRIVTYELDVDGDQAYDHVADHPVFVEHTFTEPGLFVIHCRVTDDAGRSMWFYKEITTDTSPTTLDNCQSCYPTE